MSLEEVSQSKSSFTFVWKITNFSVCPMKESECLTSPTFTSAVLDNSEWALFLFPSCEGYICLSLKCLKEPPPTRMQVEMFIKKSDAIQGKEKFGVKRIVESDNVIEFRERASVLGEADIFLPDDTLTVECCIKNTSKTLKAEQWNALTEIPTNNFTVTVPVTFPLSKTAGLQALTVPLSSVTKKYSDFKIILKSKSNLYSFKPLKIQIEMSKLSFRVFIVCKLSLQDSEGNVKYYVEDERWFEINKNKETWGLKNSIPEQEALYRSKNSIFTLHCKLAITDGTNTSRIESLVFSPTKAGNKSLPECPKKLAFLEKLRCLYTDTRLCDFTIQVHDKEFPVHKLVLGTISSVFCSMFEQDMKEKENSLLIVEDIDSDTMQRLIDFAYNETVGSLEWNSAIKLFSAADKYQIFELKQKCAEFLSSNLNNENVTDALAIADLHHDSYLKKAAEDFVRLNSNTSFKIENWNTFLENHNELAVKLLQGIGDKLGDNRLQ